MRLVRFILKQTPGVEDLDIDFRTQEGRVRDKMVVYGPTGSGKSRALDFLAGLYRIPMSLGHPDELKEAGYAAAWTDPDSVLYPAHLRPVDSGFTILASGLKQHHVEPAGEDLVEEIGAYWKGDDSRFRSGVPMRGKINNLRSISSEMRAGAKEHRGGVLLYPQNRNLGKPRMDGIKEEETQFEWIYRYKTKSSWFGSVEAWLVWQHYLDMEEGTHKSDRTGDTGKAGGGGGGGETGGTGRFADVCSLINETLQETRIVGVTRGRVQAERKDSKTGGESDSASGSFCLEDMSAGEQQTVMLLADIHRRLRPGSLLVVDAPELNLDTEGRQRLLEGIEKLRGGRRAQLLVFTSSRETAAWFASEEIVIIRDKEQPIRSEAKKACPES